MNNNLKKYLSEKGSFLFTYFRKFNLTPNNITTFGLILNAFSLINLLNNNFVIFIILFLFGYYCDILDGAYARKYNLTTKFGEKYDSIADSFKLYFLYLVFTCKYDKKIKLYHYVILVVLLLICHINFILDYIDYEYLEDKNKYFVKYIEFYKKNNLEKYKHLRKFTKYFNNTFIMIYIVILLIIIHFQ